MSTCTCTDFHDKFVAKYTKYVYAGDYDRVLIDTDDDETQVFSTKQFTQNLGEIQLLCPAHHPFFYYLAGLVHLKPEDVQRLVAHAWVYKSQMNVFFYGAHAPTRVVRGLYKAWRGFSGHSNSGVSYYYSELGHVYGDTADEFAYASIDPWDVRGNLGSTVWSATF